MSYVTTTEYLEGTRVVTINVLDDDLRIEPRPTQFFVAGVGLKRTYFSWPLPLYFAPVHSAGTLAWEHNDLVAEENGDRIEERFIVIAPDRETVLKALSPYDLLPQIQPEEVMA